MLTDLKAYLVDRPGASLTEIARRLGADPDAVRPMLEHWIRKGKVARSGGDRCGGCVACAAADLEFYAWIGARSGEPPAAAPTSASCQSSAAVSG